MSLKRFLSTHFIQFQERPARWHNKFGVFKKNHITLKTTMERIQFDMAEADDEAIIVHATFLSNLFACFRRLCSFELVREYTPSLLELKKSIASPDILETYQYQVATHFFERLPDRWRTIPIPSVGELKSYTSITVLRRVTLRSTHTQFSREKAQ